MAKKKSSEGPVAGTIKSAKIMLDLARVRGGLPQSRGYGFVEFDHHVHALACLRELNNSASYAKSAAGGGGKSGQAARVMVEFTVENITKVGEILP